MAFDRNQYWENRKAGKRGQGEIPRPVLDLNSDDYKKHNGDGQHLVQVGTKLFYTNREVARQFEHKKAGRKQLEA